MNIAPTANKQPHQNQRRVEAARAAKTKKGKIQTSHCGHPWASRIIDGSNQATLAAASPQSQARFPGGTRWRYREPVAPDARRTQNRTSKKIPIAVLSSHTRLM